MYMGIHTESIIVLFLKFKLQVEYILLTSVPFNNTLGDVPPTSVHVKPVDSVFLPGWGRMEIVLKPPTQPPGFPRLEAHNTQLKTCI